MNPDPDFEIQQDLTQPLMQSSSQSLNISVSDVDEPLEASFNARQDPSSLESIRIGPEEDVPRTENNTQLKANTLTTQVKALLIKNMSLQSKQKGTNLCQLLTPVLCLMLLLIVKNIVNAKIDTIFDFQMNFPYVFNIPYKRLYNNTLTPIKINDCLQWYLYDFDNASEATKMFVYDNRTSSGLLKNVFSNIGNSHKYYYCRDCDKEMPYFTPPVNGSINHQIFKNILYLNEQTFTVNEDNPASYLIPDGTFTFFEASPTNISFKMQINDLNFPEYHRGNGVSKFYYVDPHSHSATATIRTPDGELSLIDLISRSYLQTINPNVVLMSGSQYMPMPGFEANFLVKLLSSTESCLYPIALSLLLSVFMYTLVLEKEERLREMMKMNGLKMRNYWIANYIWNLVLYFPSAAVFLLFGIFVVQMPFFTDTNIFILILLLIGWGLCQASLSFFFQNFFSKARMVTVVGYMLSVWTTIICVALNICVFAEPQTIPIALTIYPPIAFCRLVYDLCNRCASNKCIPSFDDLTPEMLACFASLYIGAFVYLLLGLYLEQVLPQEYGVPKHPLFFIKDWISVKKTKKKEDSFLKSPTSLAISKNKNNSIFNLGKVDEDVKEERAFVARLEEPYNEYPLVIKNLRKVYKATGGKPEKVAVKDFSLHVGKGEMFGLLGPNGAGKTSLISMLTGLYTPESGNAWVAGYDIVNNIDLVRTRMGVCPQFDLLWPDLTVREHLLFYARMRGIPKHIEEKVVEKAIEEVQLQKSAEFQTKQLSGGMKRRLSVAIALVGEPRIVFLDEPTTGLDPENRRQLWDILAEARGKKAMVLTTHLMEEADVLCTRIGIVTQGQLRCIGRQARLKTKYGSGYHLLINCQTEDLTGEGASLSEHLNERILNFIKEILPKANLKSAFNGSFVFEVPLKGLKISKIFESLEVHKTELGISDWGLSQSTLEDVFMEVVDNAEDNQTH